MKIIADASLPNLSLLFGNPFILNTYNNLDELLPLLSHHDILLCRSTLKVDAKLLNNSSISCVATASSGIDHIDVDYLKAHKITLLDAKGCNANAVADYIVAMLALLQRNKKLTRYKAGVIGIGEVGRRVVMRLQAAGFEVCCYDPLKAVSDKTHEYVSLEELYSCDLLCIHANLHETPPYPSKNLINANFLAQLKSGVVIINAARGGIVNEEALLSHPQPLIYCTDVYCNEPAINPKIVEFATYCTPHIAGHSIEAKQAAVKKISMELYHQYKIPLPSTPLPTQKRPVLTPHAHWQDCILELYNPLYDTVRLKKANNKKEAFLAERQAHQNRHDFVYYDATALDEFTQLLLGNV